MDATNAGGVAAKNGFLYQDYAAALYVVQMLHNKTLLAVRCEVTDDIDLVYQEHEEHVQVKTKDDESKWSLGEICEVTKVKLGRGKPKPPPVCDSIVHKSIQCHRFIGRPDTFRMLSLRDVRKELLYLRVNPLDRRDTVARGELIAAITKRIGTYIGPGGTDITRWVDRTFWEVIPSLELIELRARNGIMQAAFERNVLLETGRDDVAILNSILVTLTKKSALSRTIYTADDKTYARNDFIRWFEQEILEVGEKAQIFKKVYYKNSKSSPPILVRLIDLSTPRLCQGMGIGQGYQLGYYRYKYIASCLVSWLPELLLRPSELADSSAQSLLQKLNLISGRIKSENGELSSLIGRALMHSTIRHYAKSEPIPVSLYVKSESSIVQEFDNVHIVRASTGDELWLGISELTNEVELTSLMQTVAGRINKLITVDLDRHRQRLLEVKEDTYLSPHDINELVNVANSFDDHIGRFRFVIFLGYKSSFFPPTGGRNDANSKESLDEIERMFKEMANAISAENQYLINLNFVIYLFPNPCVNLLREHVEACLTEARYV